jgi:hypothetical protein
VSGHYRASFSDLHHLTDDIWLAWAREFDCCAALKTAAVDEGEYRTGVPACVWPDAGEGRYDGQTLKGSDITDGDTIPISIL